MHPAASFDKPQEVRPDRAAWFEARFGGETPEQRAAHRIIAAKYRAKRHFHARTYKRIKELEHVFADRYGPTLPDDDAGADDLLVMANHLACLDRPEQRIRKWVARWAPWYADVEDLIADALKAPLTWKADALAHRIGLDDATRTRLKITTIGATDCGKAKRAIRRRKRAATREKARRAKAGATPHANSAERTKPWLALGISRATYYRRRRETGETNSCAACCKQHAVPAARSHHRTGVPSAPAADREFRPIIRLDDMLRWIVPDHGGGVTVIEAGDDVVASQLARMIAMPDAAMLAAHAHVTRTGAA